MLKANKLITIYYRKVKIYNHATNQIETRFYRSSGYHIAFTERYARKELLDLLVKISRSCALAQETEAGTEELLRILSGAPELLTKQQFRAHRRQTWANILALGAQALGLRTSA